MSVFSEKMLLATDGSEEAALAARMASELSLKLGAELHVVRVGAIPNAYAFPESAIIDPELWDQVRERAEHEAGAKLEEQVKGVEEAGGKIAGAHVRIGRPDAEIVGLAEELGVGLVVLGSRGLGGVRRALLGSVSDSVVRHAHASVLVVRGYGAESEGFLAGGIVLALDGSEEATFAAQAATELSRGTGAEVRVMSVMPTPADMFGPHFYSGEIERSLLERAGGEARRFLDEHAERIRAQGGKVAGTYLGTGRADEEIVELAEEVDAGMIVTGSRGLGGVRRALLGSVSGSVVRHARCPVLVARNPNSAGRTT